MKPVNILVNYNPHLGCETGQSIKHFVWGAGFNI